MPIKKKSRKSRTANPAKPTYPVGVSILLTNEDGQLLMAKRKATKGAGLLSTPGGRIEYDETMLEAAAREFKEECRAELGPVKIIAWKEHFRYGMHYFMFYAHATRYEGTIKNGIPDKSEDWTWHDIMDIDPATCTEPVDILEMVGRIAMSEGMAFGHPSRHVCEHDPDCQGKARCSSKHD